MRFRTPFLAVAFLAALAGGTTLRAGTPSADFERLVGQPVDLASSAYQFRADRAIEANPPEGWILAMQYANLPFNKPLDVNAAQVKKILVGLLWEEVRPVRRVELSWPAGAPHRPLPEEVVLSYFDSGDGNAHTWWNPRVVKQAVAPEISADKLTYTYTIPVDTWGIVASVKGSHEASAYAVPTIRAYSPDAWKKMEIEIEWGFEEARAALNYDGHLEAYDGVLGTIRPLTEDSGTKTTADNGWKSEHKTNDRRGVTLNVLYQGNSHWREKWPYHAQAEDVARTILTVWTTSGSFSFLASDLERGPILAPEYGFFVRAKSVQQTPTVKPPFLPDSSAKSAKEFCKELAAKNLTTVRQRVRRHREQTWEEAVAAVRPGEPLPPTPKTEIEPTTQIEVPSDRLTAQWKLCSWHILRKSKQDENGKWHFNDHPFGILASETYMLLRALDLQGMHKEAADGLDQWLKLPVKLKITPGKGDHHNLALSDRPLGHFTDGNGCLTHAEGIPGSGGHMDGVHAMGPGAIMFALMEHFRLTGDRDWLKANAPRMKANAEWILRQRQVPTQILPGGERLWSKGLQPAHVVTPDSECMYMQFYESEAYYWLGVKQLAEILVLIDPAEGARLDAAAEAYRKDLLSAIDRSIALTPVVPVRDGTYHSFIPFAPYVRGFATSAWGWRRCGGHVGALYWDTVQSASPLISPSGLLSANDPRVLGYLDVLEDRLLLENQKVAERSPGFEPDRDWFAHASWQYQCGLERNANIYLSSDDAPNFIRSWLNQYAVDIIPGEYIFREHTNAGPPDKIFEEACFVERFRQMLVMEDGNTLWIARATPRLWLEQGKKILVKDASTVFGTVSYCITSDVANGKVSATVEMPSRSPAKSVVLRLRHPETLPVKSVTVNGQPWNDFDATQEVVHLHDLQGSVQVEASY